MTGATTMTGASPHAWALRILAAAVSALLLVLGAPSAAADPQPGPTSLRVKAELSPAYEVTASGLLTDRDGRAVPDARVQAEIDGAAVADATTTAEGTYQLTFLLPEPLRTGENQLVVLFAGRGQLDASRATTPIPAAPAHPSEQSPPAEDSPTSAAPSPLPTVNLEASLTPSTVSRGGLVTVEGTLSDAAGDPIPDGRIVLLLDGGEDEDSLVLTGADGTFQTFAEIPGDQATGTTALVVSFTGNGQYAPGQQDLTVTVDELPLADPQASAGATGSVTAEPTAPAEGTADATVRTPGGDSMRTATDPDPLSWFYVALIVVGGAAVLVAAALVFRGMYGNRDAKHPGGETHDRLLEPDPDSDVEGAGLLGGAFEIVEETADGGEHDIHGQVQDGPETPGEDPEPRRRAD